MSLQIMLGTTTKRKNSTLVGTADKSFDAVLKEPTNLIRPTFLLRIGTDVSKYNYCYVPLFKRYYFITEIEFVSTVQVNIYCEVDVLATFRNDILATKIFAHYSSSAYDNTLIDARIVKGTNSSMQSVTSTISELNESGCIVMNIASENTNGKYGSVASAVLTASQAKTVAQKLFSSELLDLGTKFLFNPMQAIISAIWTPINHAYAIGSGGGELSLAGYGLGVSFISARERVTGSKTITPLGYPGLDTNSFLDSEPYSEYYIYLPGVGISTLTYDELSENGALNSITVSYAMSPINGDITYSLSQGGHGKIIKTASGNFGVNIPMASGGASFGTMLAGAGAANMGLATAAIVGLSGGTAGIGLGLASAAAGAMGVGIGSLKKEMSVTGSLGGFTITGSMLNQIVLVSKNYKVSEKPENIGATLGRPCMKIGTIGSFTGFVSGSGAYVKTWATKTEHDMLTAMLNSGSGYGGFYVE